MRFCGHWQCQRFFFIFEFFKFTFLVFNYWFSFDTLHIFGLYGFFFFPQLMELMELMEWKFINGKLRDWMENDVIFCKSVLHTDHRMKYDRENDGNIPHNIQNWFFFFTSHSLASFNPFFSVRLIYFRFSFCGPFILLQNFQFIQTVVFVNVFGFSKIHRNILIVLLFIIFVENSNWMSKTKTPIQSIEWKTLSMQR